MSTLRKMARKSEKLSRKEALIERKKELLSYQKEVEKVKANALMEVAMPAYAADVREDIIRQMFAMSYMAMHDEFGFGRERIMRWYKKMLSINRELIKTGSKTPLNDLLTALKDEYKFDIDEAMKQVNQEFDAECAK